MKNIISAVVAVVCIIVGGVAGNFLKGGSGGHETAGKAEAKPAEGGGHGAKEEHGKKEDHGSADKGGHGAEKKSGHGAKAESSGNAIYFKFTREFVIPVMKDSKVESLVILNLNLEADESISSSLFSMEPKIRDNIMTTLIELSNDGHTLVNISEVESYETIRTMVLMNLQKVIPHGIRNVLIVDIGKQNV